MIFKRLVMIKISQSNTLTGKIPNKEDLKEEITASLMLVYTAEQQWLAILPILQLAIGCEDFLKTLQKFQKDGAVHLRRLEDIVEIMEAKITPAEHRDFEVLIDECYDIIDITPRNTFIRDAGLIVGVQQVQQYQITAYISLLAQAKVYGKEKIINLIKIILNHKQEEEEILTMTGTNQMLEEIN